MTASAALSRRTSETEISAAVHPPLKWAGGKRWLVAYLERYWAGHSHRRLVEPFCGGLAVTLGLTPQRALLNDINAHLVNFYLWLRRGFITAIPFENDEALFYKYRERFNQLLRQGKAESADAAALFYFLNRTGYNGLCRFNRGGEFNVPFGRYARISYRYDFSEYKPVFADWEFSHTHFLNVALQRDDFVYADPPYDVDFTSYSKDGFSWEDQVKTAEWLAPHPGPVVLSNQATKRIVELYSELGYEILLLEAPRRINCTGDRSPAPEVLALRNLA